MEESGPVDRRFRSSSTLIEPCKYQHTSYGTSSDHEEVVGGLSTRSSIQNSRDGALSLTNIAWQGRQGFRQSSSPSQAEKTEVVTSNAASLSNKRSRENFQLSSSPPRGVGTTVTPKGGSSHGDNTGERRIKPQFSGLVSSGFPHFVPPNLGSKERKASTDRSNLSEFQQATSAYGSGLGNRSTVTTSSIEEEGSTLLHSSGQTSNAARETDTVDVISQSITQATDIGSICKRAGNLTDHREKLAVGHRERERRKSRLGGDPRRDGEVLSPFSNFFGTQAGRDLKVDKVSVSNLQDVSYEDRSRKTEITGVVSSGFSSIKTVRRESARRSTESLCSIRPWKDSSELALSSCSRELYGSSIGPDLSRCQGSVLSGMANAYKLYQPREPPRMKASLRTFSARSSTVDETLSDSGSFTTDEFHRKGESIDTLSHVRSRTASEEPGNYSDLQAKSSGEGSDPLVDGSSEQGKAPTFVLSSGRMSKEEATKIGKRPPTIDDDFDEYFAQLML